ncbi:class B sortase [Clostridium saudiense]|uniref:Class B sortase n=1 Tax=Clostridium saudiense TaxID=1414720 RepID=A0ABS2FGG0_9CLOT|nr:class B sortase [Clostridium saudiense]MBM6819411.1 class B sortase [Clostridium saudiense]
MTKKIKNVINILLFIIVIICLTTIIDKNYKYYRSNKIYQEIKDINNISDVNSNIGLIDEKLKDINSEYKFWINISNTAIDYPVVQSKDNEFYLKNNFYREEDIAGTIFIDCKNDISNDKNLILYGHNMRNGSMFADINKFKEKDFFDNGKIKIIKDGKEYFYEVFSIFIDSSGQVNLKNKFASNYEFDEYINKLKNKSIYKKDISKGDISNIITLYTCSYEFDEARTIVCASLIE